MTIIRRLFKIRIHNRQNSDDLTQKLRIAKDENTAALDRFEKALRDQAEWDADKNNHK